MKQHQPLNLYDLLIIKLRALYDVEQVQLCAIPKFVKAASDPELIESLKSHWQKTRRHVDRLIEAFNLLGIKPSRLKSEAIRGLVDDASWVINHIANPTARDTNLIAATSYFEHYEIAGYSAALEWARALHRPKVVKLLAETLAEERAADEDLAELAVTRINERVITE